VRTPVFHRSCYTTLGLAAVCLGFAEMFFLGWMPWFLAAILVVVGLAWKFEGRWQLSEPAANSVGVVIAFGMLGWIVFQLPRNEEDLLAAGVPWPAGLLPHLGPLLMILTAVKLFRPKKLPDFWVLQILGVMMVTLASVLAGEADHGVWVFLYLVSLTWCLMHYYRMSSTWRELSAEARRQTPLFGVEASAGPARGQWAGIGAALGWSMVIAVVGAGLFIFAPRHASVQWIPHRLSVAAAGRATAVLDAGMDLNRVGKIELSDEVAFEVITRNDEGRPASLPAMIYWRGETLDSYKDGLWFAGSGQTSELWPDLPGENNGRRDVVTRRDLVQADVHPTRRPSLRPDSAPPGKVSLTFIVLPAMAGFLVVAEPVNIDDGIGTMPYINGRPTTKLFSHFEGTDTIASTKQTRRANYKYGQVFDPHAQAAVQKARTVQTRYVQAILMQPPPEDLVRWSRNLLLRQSNLSEAERTLDDRNHVAPQHRARVARALTEHFAESGEYLYSLNIRRTDKSVDPNLDFLQNVKEGHCERYASGLALTLRGLGIPCRIVHGFRGWEKSDDDLLLVRFNQAHSWVQALVPRADGDGSDWILLDPTPSLEAPLDRWQVFVEWVGNGVRAVRSAFRNGVLEYGSDQQIARLRAWWSVLQSLGKRAASDLGIWIGVLVAAATVWPLGRARVKRWWHARHEQRMERQRLPWLAGALAIIRDKTGLTPAPSQTMLEFAASLRISSFGAIADTFEIVARTANRVRFGHHVLSADDHRDIARCIAALRAIGSGE
jgi:hypothetical protein